MDLGMIVGCLFMLVGIALICLSFRFYERKEKCSNELEDVAERMLYGLGGGKFQLTIFFSVVAIFVGLTLLGFWKLFK